MEILAGQETRIDFHLHPSPIHLGEVLVQSERAYSAASSRSVRTFDLEIRPSRTAQQMLQMAPGLIIAQHAGGGKAEQIFLRGFDADHGTDVAIEVDGLPVNMVSHGHGQGYADLHFIIPDVIERVDVSKGPYFAQYGNHGRRRQLSNAQSFRAQRDPLNGWQLRHGQLYHAVSIAHGQRGRNGLLCRQLLPQRRSLRQPAKSAALQRILQSAHPPFGAVYADVRPRALLARLGMPRDSCLRAL